MNEEHRAYTEREQAVLLNESAMRPTVVFLSRESNKTGQSIREEGWLLSKQAADRQEQEK